MYRLEYLPSALEDLVETARYIGVELKSPDAAERLAVKLIAAIENAREFPYAAPLYLPIRALKYEYRRLVVQNYLVFYRVDEAKKLVTVARVIYAGRDHSPLLEKNETDGQMSESDQHDPQ